MTGPHWRKADDRHRPICTIIPNWKCRTPEHRDWGDFEPFWTQELDLWHETKRTAAQSGFAGNVNSEENKQEYKQAEQAYYESLQQFGEANQDNAATFNTLTATNEQMANNIAAALQALQMEHLALVVNANNNKPPPPELTGQNMPAQMPTPQSYPISQGYMHTQTYTPNLNYSSKQQQFNRYIGQSRTRNVGRGLGCGQGGRQAYQQPIQKKHVKPTLGIISHRTTTAT